MSEYAPEEVQEFRTVFTVLQVVVCDKMVLEP